MLETCSIERQLQVNHFFSGSVVILCRIESSACIVDDIKFPFIFLLKNYLYSLVTYITHDFKRMFPIWSLHNRYTLVNSFFKSSKHFWQSSLHLNLAFLASKTYIELASLEKSLMNHLQMPTWLRNYLSSLTFLSVSRFIISWIFALSLSMPFLEITRLRTIALSTIWWHFSQYSTRFFFVHLWSILSKFETQSLKSIP